MNADVDVLLPFHILDPYFDIAHDSLAMSQNVNLRLILIDDTPSQNFDPGNLISRYSKIELVRTGGSQGYGVALREGSKFIESEAVALFNSDDLVNSSRFLKQLLALDNADLSITSMQRISQSGKKSSSLTGEVFSKEFDPIYLLFGSYGANATWVARQNWWKENSFFDSAECLDWRIGLQSFLHTKIHWNPEKLYFYRRHRGQVTSRRQLSDQSMDPVYNSWKAFGVQLGLQELSRSAFKMIATPWLYNEIFSTNDLTNATKELLELASKKDLEIYRNVNRLIKRRYINFSLNSNVNYQARSNFLFKALTEIPSISKDLLIRLRK